ncbi:rRNA (guanine-N1)-methyltransferase [Shewanella sp. WXL01]|uniref:pilus assembly protein n=1 Tax=Shewanella sp. WXL01 TaxID=2709721 RepID=UPI0014384416|nr:PilC/PilY family type IV pilus protein [Shewanella sp. WXL01]NKF52764.1 rRNA (guanine-N1)-methyltransferase [Shewanella sp. WXL01]
MIARLIYCARVACSAISFFSLGVVSLAFTSLTFTGFAVADDTELYVTESSIRLNERPQVLVIFDTSGSMEYVGTIGRRNFGKVVFKADELYDQQKENLSDSTTLYYSNDVETIPTLNSAQKIQYRFNGCGQSKDYLKRYGMFTGYLRHYNSQTRTWSELPTGDGSSIDTLDCYEDIAEKNPVNAHGAISNKRYTNGFPVDGFDKPYLTPASKKPSDIDDVIAKSMNTEFGIGKPVTLYTQKYIQWYHSKRKTRDYTRMDVARRVIENTIINTPGVEFGLAIFNKNDTNRGRNTNTGGRVIHGIKPFTDQNKRSLLDKVQNLHGVYRNYTPLCDTMYEAYSYFSGSEVHFGKNPVRPYPQPRPWGREADTGDINSPRDTSVEKGGKYVSPFIGKVCQPNASIVYITDGYPTRDEYSRARIAKLVGKHIGKNRGLPELAKWMYENDVNPSMQTKQNITTYTIGFSRDADKARGLLMETAKNGGGSYFSANSAEALQKALQKVFAEVSNKPATFSSPAVSAGRIDTNNGAFYSMFLPSKGPRWSGNIKKLQVNNKGKVTDARGKPALDDSGLLKDSACSLWTKNCASMPSGGDGSDVKLGGIAQHLQSNYNRKLYSDLGARGEIQPLTQSNARRSLGGEKQLANFMRVDKTKVNKLFKWIQGYDVNDDNNDNNTNDLRKDIMGDSLHSMPIVINYGSAERPDTRIVVGTNHGLMHMFKDNGTSVSESWAYMPKELLPNVRELTNNPNSGVHSVYGLDSSPVAHIKRNAAGKVTTAWLFFGMRRGGNAYYALDITNPDAPKFKWRVSPHTAGFEGLGQTWSTPVITHIPGYPKNSASIATAKPVMIVGGGYSPATKDSAAVGISDTIGRSVYIIDADKGNLVHTFSNEHGRGKTQLLGIADSIPNKVAVLDSNNDGLTDRIYATDTGANIWRMDLPSPDANGREAPWTGFKLASLGGKTQFSDRRFFSEPAVAQTMVATAQQVNKNGKTFKTTQNIPYDAIVIGSGHRPHPLDKTRDDKFFVVQDRNVNTKSFNGRAHKVPEPLLLGDLYNATKAAPASETDYFRFANKRGWYYSLPRTGEKSLSAAVVAKGRVFFTTYVPGDYTDQEQCMTTGKGYLYGFDLHHGRRAYKSESYETGEGIPDTPKIVVPKGGNSMYLIGIGLAAERMQKADDFDDGCAEGDESCIGSGLNMNRIYFHSAN